MKKLNLLWTGLALMLPVAAQAATGIEGSPHDFSHESWNAEHDICAPCHMAHNTDPQQLIPLWSHKTTSATFQPYESPTLKKYGVTIGQPNGSAKACLSCHDGTVAINNYGGIPYGTDHIVGGTPVTIAASANFGVDLRNDHPVSFTYDTALFNTIPGLYDPAVTPVLTAPGNNLAGQTIQKALLSGDQVQCASCHDVHRQKGSSGNNFALLVITGTDAQGSGSLLCRSCHNK